MIAAWEAARALGVDGVALGLDAANRERECGTKVAAVQALLERRGARALHVRRPENLAWLSGGGDFLIHREGPPVAEMVVNHRGVTVITNQIEAGRLAREELPPGVRIEVVPWFDREARARVAAQLAGENAIDDADVVELRRPLSAFEHARFAAVGAAASRALTDALTNVAPTMSEREVAALVHGRVRAAGVELPVLLVAGEERFGTVRHPLPTDRPFGRVGLIVICASRFGLVASLSRTIAFGTVPAEAADALGRVLGVEAAMLNATRVDAPVGGVLTAAQAAYAQVGFADAWKDHHQGGPAGYLPRDFLATPSETRPLVNGTAVAWNPSLPWAKVEDTFLLADGDLLNLTHDPRWPHDMVGARARPVVRCL